MEAPPARGVVGVSDARPDPLCSQVSGQRAADCSRKPQVNHARLWWVSLTHTLSVSAVSASSASERLRVSTVGPGGAEQVHGQP